MAAKLEIGKTLEDFCRPERMALVVYDMQVGIVRQMKNGAEITDRVVKVLDAARSGGFPVIFMRHLSMPKPLMGAFQMRQAMAWQRTDDPDAVHPWFLRGTPGFELVPELQPREGGGTHVDIHWERTLTSPVGKLTGWMIVKTNGKPVAQSFEKALRKLEQQRR